jgi:cyclase
MKNTRQNPLPIRIIPCLDVHNGRVVKGVNFVNLVDAGDPVEQAKTYDAQGADELCFLDISATNDNRGLLLDMVEKTANVCFMPFTVGGGVRSINDAKKLLRAGADKIAVNSAAIARPELICELANIFGSQCIVVAIDAKKTAQGDYEIFTHGGRNATGIHAVQWARQMKANGAGELLVTAMDRDGTKSGYDTDLTAQIVAATNLPVIASGGVGTLDHFVQGAQSGATGLLAASIFHFGQCSIAQVKEALAKSAIPVRPFPA